MTVKSKKKAKKTEFGLRDAADGDGEPTVSDGKAVAAEVGGATSTENFEDTDSPLDGNQKRKRKRVRTRKKGASSKDGDESGGGQESSATSSDSRSHLVEGTIYVEGLSYDADDADVKGFFEQVGPVVGVRMPRWHDSGKPRGYAHVVFQDGAHVTQAIAELNNQRLMGRYLKVALPKAPKSVAGGPQAPQPEGCRTVFVKNLPYNCNEAGVRELMVTFGEVRDVRLACSDTGAGGQMRLKGFGYVQFSSEVGARKAAEAASSGNLTLNGRHLYVDYDTSRGPKGSFRRTDGELWREEKSK